MNKNVIAIGVAVVGVSALLFAGVAAMRGGRSASLVATTTVATMTALESVPRISTAALREKIDCSEVLVMDVRDIDSYTASHIAGAIHIPVSYIESELAYLPRGKPIVAYCT